MTAALEAKVLADKAARDTCKLNLDTRLAHVKQDLSVRGIGGRIADDVIDNAKLIFDEGVAVVEEHPAVVGGTIAAIVLWFLRNPIIDGLNRVLKSFK
ncbi:hypothetical protein ACQEPB_08200 [Novosphingobium fluoreni]|uniref:hypothetical protein n=1 Tax=Novosphingobium fluoreni TaxID=1391222 RepID=UPI002588D4A8|nr:hypothetical protein [uncultured Novosphingobium sp.]